jgi:hypothetical protein
MYYTRSYGAGGTSTPRSGWKFRLLVHYGRNSRTETAEWKATELVLLDMFWPVHSERRPSVAYFFLRPRGAFRVVCGTSGRLDDQGRRRQATDFRCVGRYPPSLRSRTIEASRPSLSSARNDAAG